ncbi:pilus assembly protein CpaC, partial [Mesorhizobium sp. M1C.F.Ca.ET.212.01.1.1]
MRLNAKLLPFLAAATIGLFLFGANAPGLVEARAASAGVSASVATQRVKLGLNKSVVIDLPSDAYDILVANPAVADAVTRTARRIYL